VVAVVVVLVLVLVLFLNGWFQNRWLNVRMQRCSLPATRQAIGSKNAAPKATSGTHLRFWNGPRRTCLRCLAQRQIYGQPLPLVCHGPNGQAGVLWNWHLNRKQWIRKHIAQDCLHVVHRVCYVHIYVCQSTLQCHVVARNRIKHWQASKSQRRQIPTSPSAHVWWVRVSWVRTRWRLYYEWLRISNPERNDAVRVTGPRHGGEHPGHTFSLRETRRLRVPPTRPA
jgi:hypothetical protein